MITGRDLTDQELAVLASMGFEAAVTDATIDMPEFDALSLWVLTTHLEPPKRGPGPAPPP